MSKQYERDFPSYDATLPDVIKLLQGYLQEIPKEYRMTSICDINSCSGYEGSCMATIEISYSRMETDGECLEREQCELSNESRRLSAERAEYERLKSKFG